MSTTEKKISDCLLGAFVADAACMGVEWIYDPDEMKQTVDNLRAPEFKTPPAPRYFDAEEFPGHYGPGMLSPYGEQLMFVAEYCASAGRVEKDDMFAKMRDWAADFGGRPDHALATAVSQGKGADDNQAHCFTKAVAVTCLAFGSPDRHQRVEDAVRVHQENDVAVAFGLATSNILNALLLGKPLKEALEAETILEGVDHPDARQAVKDACAARNKPLEATAAARGRSCHLPEAFVIPLQACLKASNSGGGCRIWARLTGDKNDEPKYAVAVRENILAAGDVCSRAILIGAILGAADGGCPASWASQFDGSQKARVEAAAAAIAAGHNETAC